MSSEPTAPLEPDSEKRPGIDMTRPNVARMYNWFLGDPNLGGKNVRAVGYLAGEAEIDQFLDLGTGHPDMGNVHEVAQKFQPEARTVYVGTMTPSWRFMVGVASDR